MLNFVLHPCRIVFKELCVFVIQTAGFTIFVYFMALSLMKSEMGISFLWHCWHCFAFTLTRFFHELVFPNL